MAVDDRRLVGALVGDVAGEAFIEHAAERVLVGGSGRLLAADDLGRHVEEGPHDLAGAGERVRAGGFREAEVGEVYVLAPALASDQRVAGLDVAVDEAALVGGVERVSELADERQRAPGLQPSLPAKDSATSPPST